MLLMSLLSVVNVGIQTVPCLSHNKQESLKVCFYISTIVVCLCLAFYGYFGLATPYESANFYPRVFLAFVWLGIGFAFYKT